MARALTVPPRSFEGLVRAVRTALRDGQAAADRAYLQTYHRTGALIHAHLLAQQERADYGARLVPRLAEALQTDQRLLYRCLRFYRCFPILASRPELAWTHYRILIDVAVASEREALVKEAARQGWTVAQLEQRVRALNAINVTPTEAPAKPATAPKPLTPRRGTPGVCRVVADGEDCAVDLGFACYLRQAATAGLGLSDFVKVTKTGITRQAEATKADLFTYNAEILKVVDGDTLWVRIFLRPDQWVKQKLRLRDLDCPELATPEGKAAKRFVDALVARTGSVIICTTKPDKYDRYLADVFLTIADSSTDSTGSRPAGAGQGEEVYLNNALLAHGHAGRKDGGYAPADWE
jgi:endonuclease YncB( thermonuclease family)